MFGRLSLLRQAAAVLLLAGCFLTSAVNADETYPLSAADATVDQALQYLRTQQSADGAIGTFGDSAWACIAIAAAGEDPNDWDNGGPSLVGYLMEGPPEPFDEFNMGTFLARMVLAAVAAGEDPTAFGSWSGLHAGVEVTDGDYLNALRSLHDGTRFLQDLTGEADSDETLNDDFWAVRALIAADEAPNASIIQTTLQHIVDNQEDDGGWTWGTSDHTWYTPESSDVDNTAAAIVALCLGNQVDSQAVVDGLEYLEEQQHSSGGFISPWMGVNVQSSAWAVDAIGAAAQNPTAAAWTPVSLNPVDYLRASQGTEGVLGDGVRSTADALVALLGGHYVPPEEPEAPSEEEVPELDFSPSRLTFEATAGGRDPDADEIEVWNAGEGRLEWSVSADASWLSLSPTSGTSRGEKDSVSVYVDIDGLDPGEHSGRITVEDEEDRDSRGTIRVTVVVEEEEVDEAEETLSEDAVESYLLAALAVPPEGGTVSISVAPGASGYSEGTSVNVTASPSAGYAFVGWSGDAGGVSPTLTVVMNNHRTITARFLRFDVSGLDDVSVAFAPEGLVELSVIPYPVESIPSEPPGFRLLRAYVIQPAGSGSFSLQFDDLVDAENAAVFQVVNGAWSQLPRSVMGDTSLQVSLPVAETVLALAYPGASSGGLFQPVIDFFASGSTASIIVLVGLGVAVAVVVVLLLVLRQRYLY